MTSEYVAYYRVSTDRQGRSGLGLEAQKDRVDAFVKARDGRVVASYEDVMSGKRRTRPGLQAALEHCQRTGAVLVIAKLDRLARDTRLICELLDSDIDLAIPELDVDTSSPMGRAMIQFLAVVAELESGLISERTKAAYQQALKSPTKRSRLIGEINKTAARERYERVAPVARDILRTAPGASVREVCRELNRRRVAGPTGGRWHPSSTGRMLVSLRG